MGNHIRLIASDGHELGAWLSEPAGTPRAGLVVLQEIFGVTGHIRAVTDSFAAAGYLAIAPALFDRAEPGAVLDYGEMTRGRDIMLKLDLDDVVRDIAAAVARVGAAGKVGVIGYCWGGALADLAACRLPVDAAVSYYGGRTTSWLGEQPSCPVQYHFGGKDPLIPPEMVAQIRAGRPAGEFFIYPEAGHGFNCDERESFHRESAELALERASQFLDRHLGT
jgi:carboxymethylenebutenolidase